MDKRLGPQVSGKGRRCSGNKTRMAPIWQCIWRPLFWFCLFCLRCSATGKSDKKVKGNFLTDRVTLTSVLAAVSNEYIFGLKIVSILHMDLRMSGQNELQIVGPTMYRSERADGW